MGMKAGAVEAAEAAEEEEAEAVGLRTPPALGALAPCTTRQAAALVVVLPQGSRGEVGPLHRVRWW